MADTPAIGGKFVNSVILMMTRYHAVIQAWWELPRYCHSFLVPWLLQSALRAFKGVHCYGIGGNGDCSFSSNQSSNVVGYPSFV
jgi:hypothetical protein